MLSQPRVLISEIVPAPVEEVWAEIREFDEIDGWHPGISNCTTEGDRGATEIGAVRNFEAGGRTLREKLIAHSDVDRYYRYTIVEGGGAKEDYLSELRAIPVTESDETLVLWAGEFDAPAADMEDALSGLRAVYTGGIENLREKYE